MTIDEWLRALMADPDMARMGHHQRVEDHNLGLGWVYYGLARALRARHAVVIGSHRGFVPLVLGRALADNGEAGRVTFIDPSLVDPFWTDPEAVAAHFARFGVHNITHHCVTTQEFRGSAADAALAAIDLLFVDGLHTQEQARFDFETFEARLAPQAITLFHDSITRKTSRMYGEDRRYDYSVLDYMDVLRERPGYEVLDLPYGSGVTLVRRAAAAADRG